MPRRGAPILLQLEQIASGYPSRERFLTELTLDPPDATSDQAGVPLLDEDYLILSTIHSAKGQEWKSVFVLNAVDGCMPSDLGAGTTAEIEEERRLLYVAMTRAKDDLHLIVPQRFFIHGQHAQGDRHVYASRTRFIPEKLLGSVRAHGLACCAGRSRGARRGQGPSSISAPACAECRSSAQQPLDVTLPSAFECGGNRILGIFICIAAFMEASNDERLHRDLRRYAHGWRRDMGPLGRQARHEPGHDRNRAVLADDPALKLALRAQPLHADRTLKWRRRAGRSRHRHFHKLGIIQASFSIYRKNQF